MGLATTWHASGKMLARGRFAQGVRVGTWSFFDDAGQPTSKGDFKSGQRHGRWLLFDENGKPSSKGRYAKGRMVGRWTYFDPSGRKRGTCTWTPQDQDDRQVCRRNNGIKIREGLVREGLEEGVWRYFHRNGKKKAEGALRTTPGVWRFWHPSGKKKAKGSYSQGENRGAGAAGMTMSAPSNVRKHRESEQVVLTFREASIVFAQVGSVRVSDKKRKIGSKRQRSWLKKGSSIKPSKPTMRCATKTPPTCGRSINWPRCSLATGSLKKRSRSCSPSQNITRAKGSSPEPSRCTNRLNGSPQTIQRCTAGSRVICTSRWSSRRKPSPA